MNDNKKTFDTINAAALMEQEFEPLQFGIEKILPHGLFILVYLSSKKPAMYTKVKTSHTKRIGCEKMLQNKA